MGWRARLHLAGANVRCARPPPRRAGRLPAHPGHLVVLLPAGRIDEHLVRLGDLLELFLGFGAILAGADVRVADLRQEAVRLLDLAGLRLDVHAEDMVVVLDHDSGPILRGGSPPRL